MGRRILQGVSADGFGPMKGHNVGGVGYLMATTEAASHDGSSGGTVAKDGEETVFTNLHGNVVVFLFVPKGASHAATARVDLLDGNSGDAIEKAFHSGGAKECFLMAVAVDEDAGEGGTEVAVEVALLDLAVEEFINHHDVFFYALSELLVVDEVGEVVDECGTTSGLADDDGEALLNVGIEIA